MLDLLAEKIVKIDESFLLNLSRDKFTNLEINQRCKIIKFSSEWSLVEILNLIGGLNRKEYPNLFVVIITIQKIENFVKPFEEQNEVIVKIKKELLKFSVDRPLILQLSYLDENVGDIYYKDDKVNEFFVINQTQDNNKGIHNFPSFIINFMRNNEKIVDIVIAEFSNLQDLTLILKFMRILNLSENALIKLIQKCAECGSKDDLIASLDVSLDSDRVLFAVSQKYLTCIFKNDTNQETTSVLHSAIKCSNIKVVNYLITFWSHLIQQLPFDHQVLVSNAAIDNGQFDVLCDLLEICDFPFPTDTKVDLATNERLKRMLEKRTKFVNAIASNNMDDIANFVVENSNVKNGYNLENQSSLVQAKNSKNWMVYSFLITNGFSYRNAEHKLSAKELNEIKDEQSMNSNETFEDDQKSVKLLSARSFLHNKRINKDQEAIYRKKIANWYEDIYRIAPEMMDVAASCPRLKIIYDFESTSTDSVSFSGQDVMGSSLALHKIIIIGAKSSDKDHDQQIKGVLAHELCHYVMRLVYENNDFPYYKHEANKKEVIEGIIVTIDKWSFDKSINLDDECNTVISSTFTSYKIENFHPELIVRPVNILAEFDNDAEHSKYLQEKYNRIFDFWYQHVVPELRMFNLNIREEARRMNKIFGCLKSIEKESLELSVTKDFEELFSIKPIIITTNSPRLLLVKIFNHLQTTQSNTFDTRNVFVDPKKLNNEEILADFKKLLTGNPSINVFVYCTLDLTVNMSELLKLHSRFVLIANKSHENDISSRIEIENWKKFNIQYSWNDLSRKTQLNLLKTKIIFQNDSILPLMNLITADDSDIVDDELLNMLVEDFDIKINLKPKNDPEEKQLELFFQPREFIDKTKVQKKNYAEVYQKLSQKELLDSVKNKQYVIISDMAGNGKTWVMKNLANVLMQQNPNHWVTFVDLKQHIEDFKVKKDDPEFLSFFIEKILMPKSKYEGEIFKHLYKNGKVFVLFDGFDEIAPIYADTVLKLATSFQLNKGNQLWISTREFFEVDLKRKLQGCDAYHLDSFSEEYGIKLISESWVLMDSKDVRITKSKEDFNKHVSASSNIEQYKVVAGQIVQKIKMSLRSIGAPLLCKMIAFGFKDNKKGGIDIKEFKLFKKFAQKLYERWSDEMGELRKHASIQSQSNVLNFWKFHQFSAIETSFPKLLEILFPGYRITEWPEEEIVACGFMSKKGGRFLFLHDTFREFFVVDFIAKALKKTKVNEAVLQILVDILTKHRLQISQIFLEDAIENSATLKKLHPKMPQFIENFNDMENFHDLLIERLEKLSTFVVSVLATGDYEKVKKILNFSCKRVIEHVKEIHFYLIFEDFMFSFFNIDDLKEFIIQRGVLQMILLARQNGEDFEEFVKKIEAKTDREFIQKGLKLKHIDGNIFFFLAYSIQLDPQKIQKFFEVMENYLTDVEIFNLIENCGILNRNILHYISFRGRLNTLKILWPELRSYFHIKNKDEFFHTLVMHKDKDGSNFLHISAYQVRNLEFERILWAFLIEYFNDNDKLKDFFLQIDNKGNSYIHTFMKFVGVDTGVEFLMKKLKEIFNDDQFLEIMLSKGEFGRNLLQLAFKYYNNSLIHEYVWKEYQTLFESKEKFLQFLNNGDNYGANILHYATKFTPGETFQFVIEELEKIASQEEIKKMFSCYDIEYNQNLLQAACHSISDNLYEILWAAFHKYFNTLEILDFMKHIDGEGNFLLFNFANESSVKNIKFTWNKVETLMERKQIVEYVETKGSTGMSLIEMCSSSWRQYLDKSLIEWVEEIIEEYGLQTQL